MEVLEKERNVPKERIVSLRFDSMEYDGITAKEMYEEAKKYLLTNGKTYFFQTKCRKLKAGKKL